MTIYTVWINVRFLGRPLTGVERVAIEMLRALSRQVNELGQFILPNQEIIQFKLIAPKSVVIKDLELKIPLEKKGLGSGHLWEQGPLLWETRGDHLISFCNTGPIFKRQQIIFIHDAQVFAIPGNFHWKFRYWYRVMHYLISRFSKSVITNSNFSKHEIVKYLGISPEKITPVGLGCDHVHSRNSGVDVLTKFGISSKKYIFAVSSLNPNKNFALLIKALEILGVDAPLCVVSGQRLDSIFSGTSIDSFNIQYIGYVSDADLYALYSNSLCLVYPSFYEGFGLPPVEAMALGSPVITSNTSVMPEVCGDAVLYCDPHNPESLAQCIRQIVQDTVLSNSLIHRGVQRAKLFTWDQSVDKILNVLQKCLVQ